MAEQVRDVAGQAVQAAAQPVVELIWGQVQLRITDVWLARGLAIGAFYLANKALTMLAVRRAVERRDPDNPDQPADPQVGEGVREGSLLVPVIFYSQLGYQYFTSILGGPFLKACLQAELEKIGYKETINVSVEKWELPNLLEGGSGPMMGMMREERVLDWLAESPEMSDLSTATGDSGIPEDVSSEAAGSTVTSRVHMEVEPSQATLAELTSVLAQEPSQQAELQEGPLKRWRALLLQQCESPTAQTWLKACSWLEKGAAMLTSRVYQDEEGLEHLLEGLAVLEYTSPKLVTTCLYDQVGLHLDKPHLDQLIAAQLQHYPDSTPCLLIQALQLPVGHNRQQAMNHVINVVLQHGETDPMYKHLAFMYSALGCTVWLTTWQPAQALSAFASALMYKSDNLSTLYFTAWCSIDVSVQQAIRQFHHFIHTAPADHDGVPIAHYNLVTLYGQQDPSVHRDRILHHYHMAQQAEKDRLPMMAPFQVSNSIKQEAREVYEQVKRKIHFENLCRPS
ncbi:Hypp5885 [Branchiostoma lanceolatum]|uniref:Hypp5885 protein n=1 Tax=Branchiostoma lanceolatum TaxID=7740 RepID=A0A8J9W7Y3_BRALA|nr:Hypp5885 [Branchiostoma lanceolatum]